MNTRIKWVEDFSTNLKTIFYYFIIRDINLNLYFIKKINCKDVLEVHDYIK